MSQVYPDSPEVIYRILDKDTEFSSYVGTYKFNTGQVHNAISVQTPGDNIKKIQSVNGIECIIHDVSDISRIDYISSPSELVNTWKVFLVCWDPSDGDQLNNATKRILELFQGATSTQTVKTSEGARAKVQTLVTIPQTAPLSVEGMAVYGPQPVVNLSADYILVQPGASVRLDWLITNADFASMDNGVGNINLNSFTNVVVDKTTTYTISASNEFVTTNTGIEIEVFNPSIETFTATPTGNANEYTLAWTTSNAQEVRFDGRYDWSVNDSTTVTVSTPTTYVLEASSTQGSVTQELQITP